MLSKLLFMTYFLWWIYGIEKLCVYLFPFILLLCSALGKQKEIWNFVWQQNLMFSWNWNAFQFWNRIFLLNAKQCSMFNFQSLYIVIIIIFLCEKQPEIQAIVFFCLKQNSNFVKIQKWKIALRWLAAYIWWV